MSIVAPRVSAMKNKTRNVIFNEGPESYHPSEAAAKVWLVSKQITAVWPGGKTFPHLFLRFLIVSTYFIIQPQDVLF